MFFSLTRAEPDPPSTSSPESSTAMSVPSPRSNSSLTREDKTESSWELLTVPTLSNSGHTTPTLSNDTTPSLSDCSSYDTESFPKHSYMYPSERNGTMNTEILHALMHPGDTASSINEALQRKETIFDWSSLQTQVQHLASSASEQLNERLNRAFEGHDVPAMHDRILSIVPSVSMPSMRQLERTFDALTDAVVLPARKGSSQNNPLEEELQGDQWAFANVMSTKARDALVKQGICHEWQVSPTRATLQWHAQLNTALAALFIAEKKAFGTAQLFAMTPRWKADVPKKVWRLQLDTGLTDIVVDEERAGFTEDPICLPVDVELLESQGRLAIEDVEREVTAVEDGWMDVEEKTTSG